MRNYSKVGGKKGKPGYRTPKFFLNKFIQVAKNATSKGFYSDTKMKLKGYLKRKPKQ